jgi:hypothetical protein
LAVFVHPDVPKGRIISSWQSCFLSLGSRGIFFKKFWLPMRFTVGIVVGAEYAMLIS